MSDKPLLVAYRNYFFSREDVVAVEFDKRIFPVIAGDNLDNLIEAHLTGKDVSFLERNITYPILRRGKIRLGSYTLNKEHKCNHLCIDFDGENHKNSLDNPKNAVNLVADIFREHKLYPYIEVSYSGQGYHLWVFFDTPLEAKTLRVFAEKYIPKNIKLKSGIEFTPGKGIEIFPKQDKLVEGGVGNFVFLPFCHNRKDGTNCFVEKDFKLTSSQIIKDLANRQEEVSNNFTSTIWQLWREQALECLDLQAIYKDYLTGKVKGEWLECRDPESPSGDKSPSAGVASGTGSFEKGAFHSFITGETLSVFDFIRRRGIVVDNHLEACKYIAFITGVDLPCTFDTPEINITTTNVTDVTVPNIVLNNRQFRDVLQDSWQAIIHANTTNPSIFIKSGRLVKIINNSLELLNDIDIYGYLGRHVNWVKLTNNGLMHVNPPDKVAKDIVAVDHELKNSLPRIESIVNTPVFNRKKQLVYKNGYDEVGQLWLDTTINIGEIPSVPSSSDVKLAKKLLLEELFADFPFVSASDVAHTFAALLLPFIRQLIDGPTPMHVVEAPCPGTGKSKICNLISIISTGVTCEGRAIPNSDEEIRKMITAELVKSKPIILLDNAKEDKKIDSSSLAAILTSTLWADRILGETKIISLTNYALWMLTANNPQLSMEIARRCVRIRLDAKRDQPWKRSGFKHEYIEEWAKENRNLLVKSVLILIQHWIANGSPLHGKKLGSFEHWSAIIGGILTVNDIAGFMYNLEEMYEKSDIEGNEWRTFVISWYKEMGDKHYESQELYQLVVKYDYLQTVLGQAPVKIRHQKFLDIMRAMHDRTIANFKIKYEGKKFRLEGLTNVSEEEERDDRDIFSGQDQSSSSTSL